MNYFLRIISILTLFLTCNLVPLKAADLVNDYIFLLDISGSMIGEGDGKGNVVFPDLKTATKNFVQNTMPIGSHLHILTFGEKVFDVNEFNITSQESKNEIITYIDNLNAIGKRTDLYGTTQDALDIAAKISDRPVMMLIFTDGRDNVNRIPVCKVLSQYQRYKSKNPNLFVLCQYFSFSGDTKPLPFPSEIPTTRLNRDDVNFLSNLERALSQVDQKINDGLAIVKAEQEKLKKQSVALTKQKQVIEGKLKELSEGQKILSEAQEKQKNIYEEQLQSITIREESFKAEQKNRLVELQKQREILDEELAQITKKEEKLRGTAFLLIEADKLLESPIIEDVKKAKESYKSVLKTDKRNARAIQGIKNTDQKIEQLTPAYKKVRYWIYSLIILFIFFVINRLIYLDIIPGPGKLFSTRSMSCTITYNIMGSESDLDDISSKIHFREKDRTIFIGNKSGELCLDHPAVTDNHLSITRRKNKLYLTPRNGAVYDSVKNQIKSEKLLRTLAEDFFLTLKDKAEDENQLQELKIKIAVNS